MILPFSIFYSSTFKNIFSHCLLHNYPHLIREYKLVRY